MKIKYLIIALIVVFFAPKAQATTIQSIPEIIQGAQSIRGSLLIKVENGPVKSELSEIIAKMSYRKDVAWTPPEGLHISVKYLLNDNPKTIISALKTIEAKTPGILTGSHTVTAEDIVLFPEENPHVIFLNIHSSALQDWRAHINKDLEALGLSKDIYPNYIAHVTLGFIEDSSDIPGLQKLIGEVSKQLSGKQLTLSSFQACASLYSGLLDIIVPYYVTEGALADQSLWWLEKSMHIKKP